MTHIYMYMYMCLMLLHVYIYIYIYMHPLVQLEIAYMAYTLHVSTFKCTNIYKLSVHWQCMCTLTLQTF